MAVEVMTLKRLRIVMLVACVLVISVASSLVSAQTFSETRDPFVANPVGPYALLANPAAVLDTKALTLQAALGQGFFSGDVTQLIAYLEPDMGVGAGALSWHGTNLANGSKRTEAGYTIARRASHFAYYGLTLKHVSEDAAGQWSADLGLMTSDAYRLRAGLVIHNIFGQSTINPAHITGGLSYQLMSRVAIAASASTPSLSDQTNTDIGLALDISLANESHLRLGRVMNAVANEGYWLGSLSVGLNSMSLDTTLLLDEHTDQRVAVGLTFRF